MDFLALLFVANPFNILVVTAAFLGAYFILQWFDSIRQTRPLLIATIAWGLYAAWELLVQVMTPEVNIRVDLLVIWPLLAMLSIWSLYRVFRR